MAQVPYQGGVPEVKPENAPAVFQTLKPDADTFGAGVARAQVGAGRTLTNVSEDLFDLQKHYDTIATDETTNGVQKNWDDVLHGNQNRQVPGPDGKPTVDVGYMGSTGRSSVESFDATYQKLEDAVKAGRENLRSPFQQEQYDKATRQMLLSKRQEMQRHYDQQFKIWTAKVNDDGAKLSAKNIANNPYDEEAVKHNTADIIGFRVQEAQAKFGPDPVIMKQAEEDGKREALGARLDAIAVKDPARAEALLNEEGNRKIAGTQYDEWSAKVRTRATDENGRIEAKRNLAQATSNPVPLMTANAPVTSIPMDAVERIARTTVDGETGNGGQINSTTLGNISRDSRNSKSYGILGLNSMTGSAATFQRQYGKDFGLTAIPGSAEFDAQWKAASLNRTDEFKKAQLEYYRDNIVGPTIDRLRRLGIAPEAAADPRVVTYFADRAVQQGDIGLQKATIAWDQSKGNVPQFLQAMNAIDSSQESWRQAFPTAIATGVYPYAGHLRRQDTRLQGALNLGLQQMKSDAYLVTKAREVKGEITAEVAESTYKHLNRDIAVDEIAFQQRARDVKAADDAAAQEYWNGFADHKYDLDAIQRDPRLTPASKHTLSQIAQQRSGRAAGGIDVGEAYDKVYADIVDGKIKSPEEIMRHELTKERGGYGDLTPAGSQDLINKFNQVKKNPADHGVQQSQSALLQRVKNYMLFETNDPWFQVKDPKGNDLYYGQFVPQFNAAFEKWRAAKPGADPYEFLNEKTAMDLARQIRPQSERDADKLRAINQTPVTGNAPPVPAPEGVSAEGWTKTFGRVPNVGGKPVDPQKWAKAIQFLMEDPAGRSAIFDKAYGPAGFKAETVLRDLKAK